MTHPTDPKAPSEGQEKAAPQETDMKTTQIKYMVDRFLGWPIPENFSPDAGISFKAEFNENTPYPMKHKPRGTNLFDAGQAEKMIRYLVDGMPAGAAPSSRSQLRRIAQQRGEPFPTFGAAPDEAREPVIPNLESAFRCNHPSNISGPQWNAARDEFDALLAENARLQKRLHIRTQTAEGLRSMYEEAERRAEEAERRLAEREGCICPSYEHRSTCPMSAAPKQKDK